ncbi:MAG: hypothetical protein ACPGD5_08735 [Salibacteraceae bacterium]
MNEKIQQIARLFSGTLNFDEAHKKSETILLSMVEDKDFLFEIIRQNLSEPSYLNRNRHYPTLAMDVFKNDVIDMVINIFPCLPDGRENVSFQSIHHHGSLKLSTIGLSGPGYRSMIFNDDYTINPKTQETDLRLIANYKNEIGKYTFCDAYVPHVVFYPKAVSSTLVLWSRSKDSLLNKVKSKVPKKLSRSISPILNKIGMRKALDLNVAENHDFFSENGKFYALKERIGYPVGSNDNFIQNCFHYLQSVGFDDNAFLKSLLKKEFISESAVKWIGKYLNAEVIPPLFEQIHVDVDYRVNCLEGEILAAASE